MKNYLNAEERTKHIILLAMQETAEDFMDSDALTKEEQKSLKKINEWCLKFNGLIFERLGESYARKVEQTMRCNVLRMVGKYSEVANAINHVASEDHDYLVQELKAFKCLDCQREDYKNCGMYCTCIACDVDGNGKEEGCPFKENIGG